MVSQIVERLRKIQIHPVLIQGPFKTNRHARRKEAATARNYRGELARGKPRHWKRRLRKRGKAARATRRANRRV